MLDPVLRQQDSRAATQVATTIRNQLQLEARLLLKQLHKAKVSGSMIDRATALGAARQYVAIRERLAPLVALDGYTGEIKGAAQLLKKALSEQLQEPAQSIKVTMLDRGGVESPISATVTVGSEGELVLTADGYGDYASLPGFGSPLVIENAAGYLQLLVWADINSEEPTHIIPLDGALESALRADGGE